MSEDVWAKPETCPNGHPMRYPNVVVGWSPCPCEVGSPPTGHRTWLCWTCRRQWREGGCKVEGLWHQTGPARRRS